MSTPIAPPSPSQALLAQTKTNHAFFLGADSVHIAIEYRRYLEESGRGMPSRRETWALADGLCQRLEAEEGILRNTIQRGQMAGEIRMHMYLYLLLKKKDCERIDLNVFADGRVRDRHFLVNFLSATLFRLI